MRSSARTRVQLACGMSSFDVPLSRPTVNTSRWKSKEKAWRHSPRARVRPGPTMKRRLTLVFGRRSA